MPSGGFNSILLSIMTSNDESNLKQRTICVFSLASSCLRMLESF